MKIDTHIHTSNWSDGKCSVDEMIEKAIERGLDAIVVTDHNVMLTPEDQASLNARYGTFMVFRGAEVSVDTEHIILIGGKFFTIPHYTRETVSDLAADVETSGCFSYLAHPWWRNEFELQFSLDDFAPDAIDVLSLNVDTQRYEDSLVLAKKYNMQLIAGSDAHSAEHVGLFYIETEDTVTNDDDLVSELKNGRYSLSANRELLKARMSEVQREETIAKEVILARGNSDDFLLAGGGNKCFFNRVLSGGSYMPGQTVIANCERRNT